VKGHLKAGWGTVMMTLSFRCVHYALLPRSSEDDVIPPSVLCSGLETCIVITVAPQNRDVDVGSRDKKQLRRAIDLNARGILFVRWYLFYGP